MAHGLALTSVYFVRSGQMPLPAGCLHRLTTRATGGGAARRGEATSSSRRCRLGGGPGEADAAREREPSMPFPNVCSPPPLFSESQIGSSSLGNETDVFSFLVALVIRLSSNHGYIFVEENREHHGYAGIDCCA